MTINVSTFGAVGNGIADDTIALQNAINAAQAAKDLLVFEPNKRYKTTATLIVRQGGASKFEFMLDGFHSKIVPAHGGFTIDVQPQATIAAAASAQDDGLIKMANFTIDNDFATATTGGIRIGREGYRMYPIHRVSLLSEVMIEELRGEALLITGASHFDVDKFVVRNHFGGKGCRIATTEKAFTGDITFNDCQFQALGGEWGFTMTGWAPNGTGLAEVRGIRFVNSVFYGKGMRIEGHQNSLIADLWLESCAFDSQDTDHAFSAELINNGKFNKWYLSDLYFVGYTGTPMRFMASAAGESQSIRIDGCLFGHSGAGIHIEGLDGFTISGCQFDSITTWSAINIAGDSKEFQVHGNRADADCAITNLIAVGGTASRAQIVDNVTFAGAPLQWWSSGGSNNLANNVAL